MNFLRAVCSDIHNDFTSRAVTAKYDLGAKSNVSRIKTSLLEKELIEIQGKEVFIADPVSKLWFRKEYK